jgi:hypothetical protein
MVTGVSSSSGGVVYNPPEEVDSVAVAPGSLVEWAATPAAQLWSGLPPESSGVEDLIRSRWGVVHFACLFRVLSHLSIWLGARSYLKISRVV